MKKIVFSILFLLITTGLFAQHGAYGHYSPFLITADTTGNPKDLGLILALTNATGGTDTLFFLGMNNYWRKIATNGDTSIFAKIKVDTLESWSTDSVFVNDDMVFIKNILFEGNSSTASYWMDSDNDTVIVINPNFASGPLLLMTDATGADTIKFYHDGTDFRVVPDAGTSSLNFDSNTLVIDNTNNRVGIGTTAPSEKLHISGNLAADGVDRR